MPETISTLIDLLSKMDIKEANLFGKLLSKGADALIPQPRGKKNAGKIPMEEMLYPLTSDTSNALQFRQFLQDNDITYLGGGNSKNFKVMPRSGDTPYVLKLEAWAAPSAIEARVRANPVLNVLIAPIYAQREVTVHKRTVRIQILPLYLNDLEAHAMNPMTDEKRVSSALLLYQQMAFAYEEFRKSSVFFPDGKNLNWMLDSQNNLCITDFKALKQAPESLLRAGFPPEGYFFTDYMTIPEPEPHQTDKIHSLHLGKNLYQYLTQCRWTYLYDPLAPISAFKANTANAYNGCDGSNYDFSAAIFQTPVGLRLQQLIQGMVKLDPNDRLPVEEVLNELEKLEILLVQPTKAPIVSAPPNDVHVFKAKLKNNQFQKYHPDPEKNALLVDFKASLMSIDSEDALERHVESFKVTDAYKKLEGLQGNNKLKPIAIKAFNEIVLERRQDIALTHGPYKI